MQRAALAAALLALLVAPGAAAGPDETVLIIDSSAAMWRRLGQGLPRFVELRRTALDIAAESPAKRREDRLVAIRTMGGGPPDGDDQCLRTRRAQDLQPTDHLLWGEAIADLRPGGPRPLVAALRAAAADLAGGTGARRIVLVTSGVDECHEDVAAVVRELGNAEPPIELRIVGLGLDSATATAASGVASTRNVVQAEGLRAALEWALTTEPRTDRDARQLEIVVSSSPLQGDAEIVLTLDGWTPVASGRFDDGVARLRAVPGRYSAAVTVGERRIPLGGLVVPPKDAPAPVLDLIAGPAVSVLPFPDPPLAGGTVNLQVIGAPQRELWVALVPPGEPPDAYLLRTPLTPPRREVDIRVPDGGDALEVQVLHQAAPGVLQSLGRQVLESRPSVPTISAPDSAENGSPVAVSWQGEVPDGSRLAVTPAGAQPFEAAVCAEITDGDPSMTLQTPSAPGRYVVFLVSAWDGVLARRPIEVFEVLATLEAPAQAAPALEIEVRWTGPNEPQDFLSIAEPEAGADSYLSWAPTALGSPGSLAAPRTAGVYELRYVRGVDGEVLARHTIEVVPEELAIDAPAEVDAGTRFEVTCTGSPGPGDFVAVVRHAAGGEEMLDFGYVRRGSSISLAAPFEAGRYEIRYVSGEGSKILSTRPLTVR